MASTLARVITASAERLAVSLHVPADNRPAFVATVVGTVDAKHALFAALAADHDAHQAWLQRPDADDRPAAPDLLCHFSADLPDEYFTGLVSEVYNPSKNRFEKRRGSIRNEPLDTWVHAYAATHHPELRLHRARAADWDRWEADLLARAPRPEPAEAGAEPRPALPAPPAAVPPSAPPQRQRRVVGGINTYPKGWK